MDAHILSDEQWSELWEAIKISDQKGDRTILNQVLIPIMKSVVESLDDDNDDDGCEANKDDNIEKQLVIALIESELADIITVDGCPRWCCRRQRIQPFAQNNHQFSDYLINIARAKSFDRNNNGFISKDIIQQCFGTQLNERKMAELLQFVEMNNDGHINYREFATLILISGWGY